MSAILMAKSLQRSVAELSLNDRGRFQDFTFKLIDDPSHPGLSLERVQRAAGPDIWSARISQDLRAILHRDGETVTLLYAGRHDDAYEWAARHRFGQHAVTGALQVVETPELIEERIAAVHAPPELPGLFDAWDDAYLLSLGVPEDWLAPLREMKTQELFFEAMDGLPEEAAERLFALLAGEEVRPPEPVPAGHPATESPDTRRNVAELDEDELRRLLEQPLATWVRFLHPSQARLVTGSFNGPVKVSGAAGTGKTVVAMHRARHLAGQGKRVLVTSFVGTLCENIHRNLRLLCSPEELDRITVNTVHAEALRILREAGRRTRAPHDNEIPNLIDQARLRTACPFSLAALRAEWRSVIEAQGITSWEQYRMASRAGRGKALSAADRKRMWTVFERVQEECTRRGTRDWSGLCRAAREAVEAGEAPSPYDAVIVDEVQDLRPQELRLLAALAGTGPDRLMLAGDAGQRIFYGPYSMLALGVDVRGRSHVLRINYRTTEQIRRFADRLRSGGPEDPDGAEDTSGTISLLRGPAPERHGYRSQHEQHEAIALQILEYQDQGVALDEIAVFAPSNRRIDALRNVLLANHIPSRRLQQDEGRDDAAAVNLGTMHRAKGLEFKVVFIADASADAIPAPLATAGLEDPRDIDDALVRERHLLYVSMTRARDRLVVCWSGAASPFLGPLLGVGKGQG